MERLEEVPSAALGCRHHLRGPKPTGLELERLVTGTKQCGRIKATLAQVLSAVPLQERVLHEQSKAGSKHAGESMGDAMAAIGMDARQLP